MLKFTATAPVHSISPVIQVTEKFQKRELILDDSWEKDGKRYPNYVSIEFSGDKMAQLDQFYPGQRVTVEGMLTGREYNGRIFNTLRGQTVTPYQPQAQYSAPAPMPGAGYPQQQAYQQQSYAPAPMPTISAPRQQPYQAPQQQYSQPSAPGVADLPFRQ